MIDPRAWLMGAALAVTGILIALLGVRDPLKAIGAACVLGVSSCAVMILTAAPGDLNDGLYGLEVLLCFLFATGGALVGLLGTVLVRRTLR